MDAYDVGGGRGHVGQEWRREIAESRPFDLAVPAAASKLKSDCGRWRDRDSQAGCRVVGLGGRAVVVVCRLRTFKVWLGGDLFALVVEVTWKFLPTNEYFLHNKY